MNPLPLLCPVLLLAGCARPHPVHPRLLATASTQPGPGQPVTIVGLGLHWWTQAEMDFMCSNGVCELPGASLKHYTSGAGTDWWEAFCCWNTDGQILLSFEADSNTTYAVQYKATALNDTWASNGFWHGQDWTTIGTVTGMDGLITFISGIKFGQAGFFRVQSRVP